jgi:CRP-like cAMP-binding protein
LEHLSMTARNFYALEFRELNAIRWQSDKAGQVYSFRVTESGLVPVDADDERCDISIGRSAVYLYTDSAPRGAVRRPPGAASGPSGEVFRLLAPLPEFEALDDEALRKLAGKAIRREYGPGEHLVTEGRHGDSLFVLAEGHARVLARDEEGSAVPRAELGPGCCFGEMSLLTGAPRSATVRAEVRSVAYEIQKEHLRDLLGQNERLLATLSTLMAERQIAQSQREILRANESEHRNLAQAFAQQLRNFFGLP